MTGLQHTEQHAEHKSLAQYTDFGACMTGQIPAECRTHQNASPPVSNKPRIVTCASFAHLIRLVLLEEMLFDLI